MLVKRHDLGPCSLVKNINLGLGFVSNIQPVGSKKCPYEPAAGIKCEGEGALSLQL